MNYPSLDWEKGEIRTIALLPAHSDDEALSCSFEVIRLREPGHEIAGSLEVHDNKLTADDWQSFWSRPSRAHNTLASKLPETTLSSYAAPNQYIALSYQWGLESEMIIVDGCKMKVPKNLVDALKVIRSKRGIAEGARIWVDSVCIDQANTTDLNRHLPWMREIYRNATEVVVWLGKEGENSKLAIELLQTLATSSEQEVNAMMEGCLKFTNRFPVGSWLALYDFMTRDYWSRLWIIQELCMAQPSSPLLCGEDAIPWGTLYTTLWIALSNHLDAVVTLINREHLEFRGSPFFEVQANLLRRSFIYHINLEQILQSGSKVGLSGRNKENTKDAWHIQPMLDRGRVAAVSRDHDRVYGLMGMLPVAVRDLLVPDYDESVNDCYTSLARSWIIGRGDLEILSQCTSNRDPGLPSWVPDWRNAQHLRLFSGANSPYRASFNLKCYAVFSSDGKVLTTHGILIDKIDGLGSRSVSGTRGLEGVKQSKFRSNAYGSDESLREALWRTLVGNITTAGHPAKAEDRDLLQISRADLHFSQTSPDFGSSMRFQQFKEFIDRSAELLIEGRTLGSYVKPTASFENEDMSDYLPSSALEQAYRFSRLRRLATTELGYLAMVVDEALPGDIICVLLGSDVPLVLRETSDDLYEIVGVCYIHGFMQGEAVENNGEIFGGTREIRIK